MRYFIVLVGVLLFGVAPNALIDGHRAIVNRSLVIVSKPRQTYLEYKGNGDVWVLWTDGSFIQVVPK